MKFVIPKNYDFQNKFLGFISYTTLFLNIVWFLFVYCLLSLFIHDIYLKISIFISLSLPLLILSIVGFNKEDLLYVLSYIFKIYSESKNICL